MIETLHERLALTARFYVAAMGAWATWLVIKRQGLAGGYLGALVIGEALLVAEAALGAWLWIGLGGDIGGGLHVLYGLLVVLLWPFLYTFTRGGDGGRRESIVFAAGSFFLWLMLQRAVETAGR